MAPVSPICRSRSPLYAALPSTSSSILDSFPPTSRARSRRLSVKTSTLLKRTSIPQEALFPLIAAVSTLTILGIFLLTNFSPVHFLGLDNTAGQSSNADRFRPVEISLADGYRPPGRVTRPGKNSGLSTSQTGKGGRYTGKGKVVTYLPYTYGWGMLLQTLDMYGRAGWEDVVIVDNSWDHHAHSQLPQLSLAYPHLLAIVQTPVHLRFAQIQGFIDHLALQDVGEEGVYLWSHTDVLILRNGTMAKEGAEAMLPSGRQGGMGGRKDELSPYELTMMCVGDTPGRPGVQYFAYDWLSAVYTSAAASAPWDPSMPQYGADCDRYARLRLAGYETWDCARGMGRILHLHTVLSREQMAELYDTGKTLEEQIEFVDSVSGSADQYAWRDSPSTHFDSITDMDRAAASAEDVGGRKYYTEKWGEPFDCELGGRRPKWDVMRMDDLQVRAGEGMGVAG